jgi:hypothetical protein
MVGLKTVVVTDPRYVRSRICHGSADMNSNIRKNVMVAFAGCSFSSLLTTNEIK